MQLINFENEKIFGGPNRYIQGPDAIKNIGSIVMSYQLGHSVLNIIDKNVFTSLKDDLLKNLKLNNIDYVNSIFNGECCEKEISRVVENFRKRKIDFILGAGGGKTLDTAKIIARRRDLPVVLVPTIAASDAACSSLSVLYDKNGKFSKALFFNRSPELVVADSKIISTAPVRFLIAGMGDALSTGYEAEACYKGKGKNSFNGKILYSVLHLAKLCSKLILKHGEKAKKAVEKNLLTEDVEKIIEANLFLSTVGFESGGLAAAHSITDGLTFRKETKSFLHGEKVAFSLIAQLVMENKKTKTLRKILNFCHNLGLPICFKQVGLKNCSKEDVLEIAKKACERDKPIHNMLMDIDEYIVRDSLIAADDIGKKFLEGKF